MLKGLNIELQAAEILVIWDLSIFNKLEISFLELSEIVKNKSAFINSSNFFL